jgi:hypothetical protein
MSLGFDLIRALARLDLADPQLASSLEIKGSSPVWDSLFFGDLIWSQMKQLQNQTPHSRLESLDNVLHL